MLGARRVALALLVIVGLYSVYIAYLVWHESTLDERKHTDAIVVLGAAQYNGVPSAVLKARLDHAATLWKQQVAPVVVVTGGKIPGDKHTEAGASAAYLAQKGVPDSKVLREVGGRTSWQSLQAAALFLKQRDIHSITLVSDSFHDARIAEMASDLRLDPHLSPTRTSPITGVSRLRYFAKEAVSLGLGKIFGFDKVASLERSFASKGP